MTGTPTTEIAVATVPNAQKWACRGAKYESDNMPAAAMMIQSVIFSLKGRLFNHLSFFKRALINRSYYVYMYKELLDMNNG